MWLFVLFFGLLVFFSLFWLMFFFLFIILFLTLCLRCVIIILPVGKLIVFVLFYSVLFCFALLFCLLLHFIFVDWNDCLLSFCFFVLQFNFWFFMFLSIGILFAFCLNNIRAVVVVINNNVCFLLWLVIQGNVYVQVVFRFLQKYNWYFYMFVWYCINVGQLFYLIFVYLSLFVNVLVLF